MKLISRISLFVLIITFGSCDDDTYFDNPAFRKGVWANADQTEFLEFIDESHVVRRGDFYNEEYVYKIKNDVLYMRVRGFKPETEHPILKSDSKSVKIGNFYIMVDKSFGSIDNTMTFYKQ